jgi:hypothetical protein
MISSPIVPSKRAQRNIINGVLRGAVFVCGALQMKKANLLVDLSDRTYRLGGDLSVAHLFRASIWKRDNEKPRRIAATGFETCDAWR